jgi:hypothetical protein
MIIIIAVLLFITFYAFYFYQMSISHKKNLMHLKYKNKIIKDLKNNIVAKRALKDPQGIPPQGTQQGTQQGNTHSELQKEDPKEHSKELPSDHSQPQWQGLADADEY